MLLTCTKKIKNLNCDSIADTMVLMSIWFITSYQLILDLILQRQTNWFKDTTIHDSQPINHNIETL